jgi:hypothetical protein
MFEDWLLAVGFPDGPSNDQRKAALLRASLGTEGYRLYNSLTPEAELKRIVRQRGDTAEKALRSTGQ